MGKITYSYGSNYNFRLTIGMMIQTFFIILFGVVVPYIYISIVLILIIFYAMAYSKYKKEVLILEGNYIYKSNPFMSRKIINIFDYEEFKLEPSLNSFKITAYNPKFDVRSRILVDEFSSPIEEIYKNIISMYRNNH
ncbi:MAG: hypothetical protein KQ78_01639 [Candidatus Izimaplasma bacterium HR2]|nr:MAG: hypothetical protein KQ78_01639 [Candidatus Izimaplasma bacterium HR2]